jgi:hypothetical protein
MLKLILMPLDDIEVGFDNQMDHCLEVREASWDWQFY